MKPGVAIDSVSEEDVWRPPDTEKFYAMTLDAIAAELGLSGERVRQIEAKALKKLRKRLKELA